MPTGWTHPARTDRRGRPARRRPTRPRSGPEARTCGRRRVQRLWTPWRLAYVTGGTVGDGCVFCRAATSDDPLVVKRGETTFVILNLFPYNSGHVMVVP